MILLGNNNIESRVQGFKGINLTVLFDNNIILIP